MAPTTKRCRDCGARKPLEQFRPSRYTTAGWRRSRYGLDPAEVEALLVVQGGRCAMGHPFRGAPVVDHDHRTGVVRGMLCAGCNCGIGLLRDDPDLCDAAARYLERYRLHPG